MSRAAKFEPKHLREVGSLESMSMLSPQYWRVAQELRRSCRTPPSHWPGHYYAFPAVFSYCACFEAFLNEHLAFAHRRALDSEPRDLTRLQDLSDLIAGKGNYLSFGNKLKRVYELFAKHPLPVVLDSEPFASLLALRELRHVTAHYAPTLEPYKQWPARLQSALSRAKPTALNSGWTTNFSQAEVADWAGDAVKEAVQLFCQITGSNDPFAPDAHWAIRWDHDTWPPST